MNPIKKIFSGKSTAESLDEILWRRCEFLFPGTKQEFEESFGCGDRIKVIRPPSLWYREWGVYLDAGRGKFVNCAGKGISTELKIYFVREEMVGILVKYLGGAFHQDGFTHYGLPFAWKVEEDKDDEGERE